MSLITTTQTTQTAIVPRHTIHTTKSYISTLNKLYSSIGRPESVQWPSLSKNIKGVYTEESRVVFEEAVHKAVGEHGFMIFQEFNHGAWVPLFPPYDMAPRLQMKRIILGNPLIAITMLEHDLTTGLSVPVEILLQEKEDGGCEVVYLQPSGLIASGRDNEKLEKAAKVLDAKLAALISFITSGDSG